MFRGDGALLGHDGPAAICLRVKLQHTVVLSDRRTLHACRLGIGMHHARRIDVAFALGIESAQHVTRVEDRARGAHLVRACKAHILDAHGLEHAIGSLQPFPAFRCRCHRVATGHMHANTLAGLLLDLGQEIDGVGLQGGYVRVGVQRMEAASGMPARSCRQHRTFEQHRVVPAQLGKVIQHGCADDTTADDGHPVVRLHGKFSERDNIRPGKRSSASCPCPAKLRRRRH